MDDIKDLIGNKYFIALIVPVVFFLIGGVGRILTRKSDGLIDRKDWFLAVDTSLANIAAGLIQAIEILNNGMFNNNTSSKIAISLAYVCVAFLLYMITLSVHQKWENMVSDQLVNYQRFGLVIGANAVALTMMFIFIIIIKGV